MIALTTSACNTVPQFQSAEFRTCTPVSRNSFAVCANVSLDLPSVIINTMSVTSGLFRVANDTF